jgi:hypothetical protein
MVKGVIKGTCGQKFVVSKTYYISTHAKLYSRSRTCKPKVCKRCKQHHLVICSPVIRIAFSRTKTIKLGSAFLGSQKLTACTVCAGDVGLHPCVAW